MPFMQDPDTPPEKMIQMGAGWGALERLRRESSGEGALETAGISFPEESMCSVQDVWLP